MSMCLRDLGEVDPASSLGVQWDQLVLSSPASGLMQSTHWAQFKRQMGLKVCHLGLFAGEQLFGGGIFYAAPNCKGAGFLTAPDGPVLPWDDPESAECGLQLLLESIEAEARSLGTMALRIAPRLVPPQPDVLRGFAQAPIGLTEHKTMYLDLQPDTESLLKGIKPKARYNIGLAERRGVRIREESSLTAARNFYTVMQAVGKRDGFSVEPLSFFIAFIDSLCPPGLARVFFAEHDGDVLGALLMVTFGERSTYLYGGTTDVKRNLMGGYALQWAAIKAAQESGAKIYDFWGYDPTASPDNSYAGFSRFKSQFCGESVDLIGTLDFYFINHLADVVIRAINEIHPSC
jgi:peptidoglycan pentaglycine glycine transferase (the first glycine)